MEPDEDVLIAEPVEVKKLDKIIALLEEERRQIDDDLKTQSQEELLELHARQKQEEEPFVKELKELSKERKEKINKLRQCQMTVANHKKRCVEERSETYSKYQKLEESVVKEVSFS